MGKVPFSQLTDEEKLEDLKNRVNSYMMLQLPGQPMAAHMGTTYLINDLWDTVDRLSNELKRRAK